MVRQDRGLDPNLVDLFSCRFLRSDRDEVSVSFQINALFSLDLYSLEGSKIPRGIRKLPRGKTILILLGVFLLITTVSKRLTCVGFHMSDLTSISSDDSVLLDVSWLETDSADDSVPSLSDIFSKAV